MRCCATAPSVFRSASASASRLAGIGTGLVVALFASRILGSLLFGVASTDVATYAVVSVGLLLVVLFASIGPARRAVAVDPVETIRAE